MRNAIVVPGRRRSAVADGTFDCVGLTGWLRGRFPTGTEHHVEAHTGIAADTVLNWLQCRSRPSADHLSTLLLAFGPSLFRACVRRPAMWLDRACQIERIAEIDAQMNQLNAERAALMRPS